MKRIIATSILASCTMLPFLAHVHAESATLQTLEAESKVEIRKGATTNYPVVSQITPGQQVTVLDEFKNSVGETWYRVTTGTQTGWGPANNFVETTVAFDTFTIGQAATAVNHLNIRRGATSSYPITGTLSKGTKVTVLDQFKNASGETWIRIKSGNATGWVLATALTTDEVLDLTLYINVDIANLRSGPSTSHSILSKATKGTKIKAFHSEADINGDLWYEATTESNLTVWVHESVVSTTNPTALPDSKMMVGTYSSTLRSGASTSYKIIQKLPIESLVTVTSEFTNSLNQTWLKVKTASGQTGWVQKNELVKSKSELTYVYAYKNAVIRRGASTKYAVSATLKENDSMIVVGKHNNWLNVENAAGTRGWIDQSLTSTISLKRLTAPTIASTETEQLLTWKKPMDFSFKYSTLSSNRLKLEGGITDIELPTTNPVGIESIETFPSGAEKSVVITLLPGYTFTLRDYADKVTLKVVESGLKGKKVVIDPGHGGKDTGAIGPSGLKEKDVLLQTALLLKTELEKYGAIVTLTRSTDVFLELSQRTSISNSKDYDAFVSLHADSFSASSRGSTSFYNTTVNFNGPRSKDLGEALQSNLVSALGTYNRGVKDQELYVNRMNEIPSVLVELAFISNPNEEALLKTQAFRQKAAVGLQKGLEQYFSSF